MYIYIYIYIYIYMYIYVCIYIFSTKIYFLQQSLLLFHFLTEKATELLRISPFWNTKSCVLVTYFFSVILDSQSSQKSRKLKTTGLVKIERMAHLLMVILFGETFFSYIPK